MTAFTFRAFKIKINDGTDRKRKKKKQMGQQIQVNFIASTASFNDVHHHRLRSSIRVSFPRGAPPSSHNPRDASSDRRVRVSRGILYDPRRGVPCRSDPSFRDGPRDARNDGGRPSCDDLPCSRDVHDGGHASRDGHPCGNRRKTCAPCDTRPCATCDGNRESSRPSCAPFCARTSTLCARPRARDGVRAPRARRGAPSCAHRVPRGDLRRVPCRNDRDHLCRDGDRVCTPSRPSRRARRDDARDARDRHLPRDGGRDDGHWLTSPSPSCSSALWPWTSR